MSDVAACVIMSTSLLQQLADDAYPNNNDVTDVNMTSSPRDTDDELHTACAGEGLSDSENDSPGCVQYSFIIYTVITGSLCFFGSVGNVISFCVFHVDRLKTSTSFLFQSLSVIDTLMLIGVFPLFCIPNFVSYTGWYAITFILRTVFYIMTMLYIYMQCILL